MAVEEEEVAADQPLPLQLLVEALLEESSLCCLQEKLLVLVTKIQVMFYVCFYYCTTCSGCRIFPLTIGDTTGPLE